MCIPISDWHGPSTSLETCAGAKVQVSDIHECCFWNPEWELKQTNKQTSTTTTTKLVSAYEVTWNLKYEIAYLGAEGE